MNLYCLLLLNMFLAKVLTSLKNVYPRGFISLHIKKKTLVDSSNSINCLAPYRCCKGVTLPFFFLPLATFFPLLLSFLLASSPAIPLLFLSAL